MYGSGIQVSRTKSQGVIGTHQAISCRDEVLRVGRYGWMEVEERVSAVGARRARGWCMIDRTTDKSNQPGKAPKYTQ